MARRRPDSDLTLTLAPDLREWIDAQATDIGCDAATWVKMLLVARRKGRGAIEVPTQPLPLLPAHAPFPPRAEPNYSLNVLDDDAWRGDPNAADGPDVAAMPPPDIVPLHAGNGAVRALGRVPVPYTPQSHVGAPGGSVTVTGRC